MKLFIFSHSDHYLAGSRSNNKLWLLGIFFCNSKVMRKITFLHYRKYYDNVVLRGVCVRVYPCECAIGVCEGCFDGLLGVVLKVWVEMSSFELYVLPTISLFCVKDCKFVVIQLFEFAAMTVFNKPLMKWNELSIKVVIEIFKFWSPTTNAKGI